MKRSMAVFLALFTCLSFAAGVSAEEIAAVDTVAAEIAANDYTVGNTVVFGAYEQDNDKENGEEPIEWIVLDVDGGRAMLISKYALDAEPFNTYTKKMTWCKSSLRRWLNYNFYKEAFIVEEREYILSTTIVNDGVPGFSSYGCDDSEDSVFLLSYEEALTYFRNEEERQVRPTAYAIANGAYADGETGSGWWWLRSMGADNTSACGVKTDGRVSGYGSLEVYRTSGSVRPVIWLNIGGAAGE